MTVLVYWPGLSGGYIHDDFSFIVENPEIRVDTGKIGEWIRAAGSFPAAQSGRWLTMLSFGANYYFTGLDPFWIKLTNLAIHLLNGALLLLALRALLDLKRRIVVGQADDPRALYGALAVAACWMLLPINLTAVLYSAQRLESLSNTFVLLGLLLYFRGRIRCEATGRGYVRLFVTLALTTGVGLLAKESAALLPLYTCIVEFAFGGFWRSNSRRPLTWLYGLTLGLPLLAGLAWLATWIDNSAAGRDFTTLQRVTTEWRVLVDYIGWTVLPLPRSLALYHDDFTLSQGLLSPPSTLLALLALLLLLGVAVWQRRSRPLFFIGVLWWFGGHALTASFIPFELVYEHRNYFPSCGLLLAIGALFAFEPLVTRVRMFAPIACGFVLFYAFETGLRAREWSHPLALALAEAQKHPEAARAQYELGRALTVASGYKLDSPLLRQAQDAFRRCMAIPQSSLLCEQGLIILAAQTHAPIDDAWWDSMIAKLHQRPATESDVNALGNLLDCQVQQVCPQQSEKLGEALLAGMARPSPNQREMLLYADFAGYFLGDYELAERLIREVVAQRPRLAAARGNLVSFLISRGRLDEARAQLVELRKLDRFGSLAYMLSDLDARLAAADATAHLPKPAQN